MGVNRKQETESLPSLDKLSILKDGDLYQKTLPILIQIQITT
jgi:hypothetical protein